MKKFLPNAGHLACLFVGAALVLSPSKAFPTNNTPSPSAIRRSLEAAQENSDYIDLSEYSQVSVDLKYGSTDNLIHVNVYDGFQKFLLHKDAAKKFYKAVVLLKKRAPELSFLVFDALRPHSAQILFWDYVKGTPLEPYFVSPELSSVHSFGFAIDLTLVDQSGTALDMGTKFDELSDLSWPAKEDDNFSAGLLSEKQISNREFLRKIMIDAGFTGIPHEWWHFDALLHSVVTRKYKRLD